METEVRSERGGQNFVEQSLELQKTPLVAKNGNIIISDSRHPGSKNINISGGQTPETHELAGVLCRGVQYYDLEHIVFINNAGIASLIDLLKSLLKQGVEAQFVNVNKKIREKIKAMGLENVLNCS